VSSLERIAASAETLVLFESAGRTPGLLTDLEARCGGDREAAVARELTKVHEEFRRGTLAELAGYYGKERPRGEVTIVVAPKRAEGSGKGVDLSAGAELAATLLGRGVSPSRVAREVARRLGIPRNVAYDLVVELSRAEPEAE
jgi:16S rRNA (cytidine1402-2'-O)-methyltransferase